MKIKFGIPALSLLLVSGFAYSYYVYLGNVQSASKSEAGMLCHVPDATENHDHQAMMANKGMVAMGQNPDQDPDQPGPPSHRLSPGDGCSSVNPNAPDKRRDGVNPNTVGCKCAKKCVDGRTQEDRSKDKNDVYICRNACHTDRCTCPDPCKT